MNIPRLKLVVTERGHFAFEGISVILAVLLQEVPAILDSRHEPPSRERLFPAPTQSDAEWNETWRQLVTPELESLFHTAGETMARDLAALSPQDKDETSYRVEIPREHLNAWMSALNQARLILAAQHDITEQDMDIEERVNTYDRRSVAVMKIKFLGWFLELIVQAQLDDV
jgi:hypothetical protein